MNEFLRAIVDLPIPFNMVVLIVLIVSITGAITAAIKEVRKYFCHRSEMELKREMIERGMEAAEVERIMQASSNDADRLA